MSVLEELELLQAAVRSNELSNLNVKIVELMERIMEQMIGIVTEDEQQLLNAILEGLFDALQNLDLQLVVDLIEFELKPFYIKTFLSKERS